MGVKMYEYVDLYTAFAKGRANFKVRLDVG